MDRALCSGISAIRLAGDAMITHDFPRERFEYIGWPPREHDAQLPVLVVGIPQRYPYLEDYTFREPHEWRYIAHQGGGFACHQHYITGQLLIPTAEMCAFMQATSERWLHSNVRGGVSLDDILVYRRHLHTFNLDCNHCYWDFEEGIYLIDLISVAHLRTLCTDDLPDDLDDWIDSGNDDLFPSANWSLFILGENCD